MDHHQEQQEEQQPEQDTPTCPNPTMPTCTKKQCCEQNVTVCMECQTNRFQYVCPRCAFKSCSLKCCKAHKERLKCNGKRNRAAFVPIRRMNDATLQSDYHFLEDVCAQMERTSSSLQLSKVKSNYNNNNNNNIQYRKRPRQDGDNNDNIIDDHDNSNHSPPPHPLLQQHQQQQPTLAQSVVSIPGNAAAAAAASLLRPEQQHQSNHQNHLHPKWRHFATLAWERYRIQILYMPSGMHRRMSNKSYIQQASQASKNNNHGNKRNNHNHKNSPNNTSSLNNQSVLYWTLEWRLHNPTSFTTTNKINTTNDNNDQNKGAVHHHLDDDNNDKNNNGTTTNSTIITTAAPSSTDITGMTSTSPVSEMCSVGDALVQQLLQSQNKNTINVSSLELYTVMIAMSNQQQQQQAKKHHHRRRRLVYYRKVSMESTIAEALQDSRIIEYPTFEIVHSERLDEFPQFIQTVSLNE